MEDSKNGFDFVNVDPREKEGNAINCRHLVTSSNEEEEKIVTWKLISISKVCTQEQWRRIVIFECQKHQF
jgi:hypothetical protein